jgi:hypothetical protein
MERLTVTQAALRWGVSRTAILTWIRTGRLTADDVELEETPRGRVWWILRADPPPHRPEALIPPRRR